MPLNIRRGEYKDIPWIVTQLKVFSPYYGTKKSLFGDEEYVAAGLKETMDKHLVLVADKNGQLIGFIIGLVSNHLYNPSIRVLTQLLWWVDESKRFGRAGYMLLKEFVKWGKANCDWIAMGAIGQTQIKPTAFQRMGFKPFEITYLMEVGNV